MRAIDPELLTFDYRLRYRGVPGIDDDPSGYPLRWEIAAGEAIFADGNGEQTRAGRAVVHVVPRAGMINLVLLAAVDRELAGEVILISHRRAIFWDLAHVPTVGPRSLCVEDQQHRAVATTVLGSLSLWRQAQAGAQARAWAPAWGSYWCQDSVRDESADIQRMAEGLPRLPSVPLRTASLGEDRRRPGLKAGPRR